MVHKDPVDLGAQRVEGLEVLHPNSAAAHFVFVGRADATPRGADFTSAGGGLAQLVELAVEGQDECCVFSYAQVLAADRDALSPQFLDFGAQRPRVDDDAIADHAEFAGAHDARWQQRQLVGVLADDQRVAGVVAALEPHDDVGAFRKPIDDLAFALVAPLGADHHNICHSSLPGHDLAPAIAARAKCLSSTIDAIR